MKIQAQLRLWFALLLWGFLAPASFLLAPAAFAYDEHGHTTTPVCSGSLEFNIAYDVVAGLAATERNNCTTGESALFAEFPYSLAAKTGPATWNEFQAATRGQFATRAEAGQAWAAYKDANGIVTGTTRSMAARSEYLRSLADNPNTASWMKPWLQEGRVPPGYEVDHIKPLSIGGPDTPANMRLQGADLHDIHHRYYRPWE